jgi:hypothetical protein
VVGVELSLSPHDFIAGRPFAKRDARQTGKLTAHFSRAGVVIYNHQFQID